MWRSGVPWLLTAVAGSPVRPAAGVARAVARSWLTRNVRRQIPCVDNFRCLWIATPSATISCAQAVDGIGAGRCAG
jgi:uncharacterized membrane protein